MDNPYEGRIQVQTLNAGQVQLIVDNVIVTPQYARRIVDEIHTFNRHVVEWNDGDYRDIMQENVRRLQVLALALNHAGRWFTSTMDANLVGYEVVDYHDGIYRKEPIT